MPMKSHSVIPALKDHLRGMVLDVSGFPTGSNRILFMDPMYDYEVKLITALVTVITTAAASPFTLGYGAYTDIHGNIIAENATFFLSSANCLDKNGQSFSTQILAAGTLNVLPAPTDPTGLGLTILPAGAPLIVVGSNTANTGEVYLQVALRPKDKDRNDSSKRPAGAADHTYASYYK